MSDTYLISIDCGTESARAAIFSADGKLVATHAEPYPLRHPKPGWAEQRPDEWWASIVGAIRGTVEQSGLDPESIVGISGDFTCCSVVFLDEQFQPLRPAIIWMDVRAADQARRIAASGYDALKYNGYGNVSAEWMPCKALWVKENEPEVWEKTAHLGEFNDWFFHRLTGEWVGSINNVTVRWYYNQDEGGFPRDFYTGIGLEDALEKFPQRILNLGEVVGTLRADVAAEFGLKPGIPVAQGGADAFIAMFGLNVVEPGKMAFIVGSSHLLLGQAAYDFHGKGIFGTYPHALVPGQYTVEGGQISTGSIVRWFRDNFATQYIQAAEAKGVSAYDLLTAEAEKLPPGSDGLIVLDYWQGNRTPYVDPEARGMMWGFTLSHTPAHVYRAIIEGIAYGTEHILRTMREHGYEVKELVAAGGPTKSPMWMQIHADVSNTPITLTEAGTSAAILGGCICAALGAGVYDSIAEACNAMVRVTDRIEPNPERHEQYQFFVDKYICTYPQMQELMHDMCRHIAKQK
ncbi:MAG TPA: FGGY family carbohydrate kinase [Aggregatilineales bacterium]|nr:FGGY family carbohydrate kinase [Aggregatilineales bacterium]HQA66782.1 FGGY family carbohydrate kinase [Aggregatilineales bacterium]HQE17933.1 FGGY family carbohydrate kinase [Aggregatilineales bacterium]